MRREAVAATFDRIDRFAFLTEGGRRRLIDATALDPLGQPAVARVLSGAVTERDLAEAVAVMEAVPMTTAELARIAAINAEAADDRG